jgi:hypothetical protein
MLGLSIQLYVLGSVMGTTVAIVDYSRRGNLAMWPVIAAGGSFTGFLLATLLALSEGV